MSYAIGIISKLEIHESWSFFCISSRVSVCAGCTGGGVMVGVIVTVCHVGVGVISIVLDKVDVTV